MRTLKSLRRIAAGAVALAATTTAVATVATAAVPAHAAGGGAADCLERLVSGGVGMPQYAIASPTVRMPVSTSTFSAPTCSTVVAVSIGISRIDGSDFRNANAHKENWEADAYLWVRSAPFTSKDTGAWMIRQIVVKDNTGYAIGHSFTSSRTPDRFSVRAGTVISPRQHGVLRPGAGGRVTISGDLKAWNTLGGLSPLAAGQRLAIEARDPYQGDYFHVTTVGTAPSGWFRGYPVLNKYRGFDIRLAYYSPYQTIAGSFAYVGRVG